MQILDHLGRCDGLDFTKEIFDKLSPRSNSSLADLVIIVAFLTTRPTADLTINQEKSKTA